VARRLRAPTIILAASTVQNARLLLSSRQRAAPGGIGNAHGQVGRYFACHQVISVYGMLAEATENHLGVTAGSLVCQDGYEKERQGGPFGSYQWGIAPALKPNDLLGIALARADLWGAPLHEFMRRAVVHLASMNALCETQSTPENRIELAERSDSHGVPLARVVHGATENDRALAALAVDEGVRVMRAAGAAETWQGIVATAHPLGGTVMGASAADSVTDGYGGVHGVPGLFVAGGGLFPSTGGGSPTFTILALAERASEFILRH